MAEVRMNQSSEQVETLANFSFGSPVHQFPQGAHSLSPVKL